MLSKAEIVKWRRFLFRTVQSADRRLKPSDAVFSAAMVMAGVSVFGVHRATLAQVCGFSEAYVGRVLSRLRKARLLRGESLRVMWDHDQHGDIAFICDALVASGAVVRMPKDGTTAAGQKRRQAWRDAGRCVNCGGDRDGAQATCLTCRGAVARSAQRRVDRERGVWTPQWTPADPRYKISGDGKDDEAVTA
jgi:hypothetical protein